MAYYTRLDIANRAAQHLGVPRITAFTDEGKFAREANFVLDMVRRTELQRGVWTFATKRAVSRRIVSGVLSTSRAVGFASYAAGTTYGAGDVATYFSYLWLSRKGSNLANTPGGEGADPYWVPYFGSVVAGLWNDTTVWYPGDVVYEDTLVYVALDQIEVTTLSPAYSAPQPSTDGGTNWHEIEGAAISALATLSPLGYRPDASAQRNIHRLPANWLRMAPQTPKRPAAARLNVTAGMNANDWEIEEPHWFTTDEDPIILRFVADQTDVSTMHPLFNEVWAARAASELAETVTQSSEKKVAMLALYSRYVGMARLINAVEAGTTEDEPGEAAPQQQQR